jgi:hypothetical protein
MPLLCRRQHPLPIKSKSHEFNSWLLKLMKFNWRRLFLYMRWWHKKCCCLFVEVGNKYKFCSCFFKITYSLR